MKPLPSTEKLVANIRHVLPDAQAAWLFGSAARNELHDKSDIDIAVWLPSAWNLAIKIKAYSELSAAWNRPVDVLDFLRLHTVMQVQVIETGKLLFAHNPVVIEMQCATIRTEYLHMQNWRQPMIKNLVAQLTAKSTA